LSKTATISEVILNPRIFLEEQSKDEFIDEILRLRQENEALQKENYDVKKKLKPSFIKENSYKKKAGCQGPRTLNYALAWG